MKAHHTAQYRSLMQLLFHTALNYTIMYLEMIKNFPGKTVFLKIQAI